MCCYLQNSQNKGTQNVMCFQYNVHVCTFVGAGQNVGLSHSTSESKQGSKWSVVLVYGVSI